MKLPNRRNVVIAKEKLKNYLLSQTHPVGSSKAKFFRRFGFNENSVDELIKSLTEIAQMNEVKEIRELVYGRNYAIDGTIETPSGKKVIITTVWFIKTRKNKPSFVTAYPV